MENTNFKVFFSVLEALGLNLCAHFSRTYSLLLIPDWLQEFFFLLADKSDNMSSVFILDIHLFLFVWGKDLI